MEILNQESELPKSLDYWEWREQFKPVPNHFDKTAGIDGCLFQPFGEEWEHVRAFEPEFIWSLTVTDTEENDGTFWEISNGLHVVNREGYIIAGKPCFTDISVEY